MLFLRRILPLFVVVSILLGPSAAHAADPVKTLSPYYRHWLTVDVAYIINTEERKHFLEVHSDAERDSFIKAFWEARNPDPGSEINTYKEEHYRRFAYANSAFGDRRYEDGWRTDMGRIYITLGAPKQRAPYHLSANIRELEIWFYESQTPALPAYFNIVFFREGSGEAYKLYSPRIDGPQKITSTGEHDNKLATDMIKRVLGEEVARTMLSLIPSEPVDLDAASPSLDSDLMLNTIRTLPDSPAEKARLSARRSQEQVLASLFTGQNSSDLLTDVFRDERGRQTVHFLVRQRKPDARIVGTRPDKTLGYSLTLRVVVATADGKAVYQQQEPIEGHLTEAQAQVARTKPFAAEGRMPLVPGSYQMEATLTNNLTHEATRSQATVTVPAVAADKLGLSDLLAYAATPPAPDPRDLLPFSLAKLRFTPRAPQRVFLHPGEKLPVVFQLWIPTAADGTSKVQDVHLHYVYGSVAGTGTAADEDEDVAVTNADRAGNVVTGHTLRTDSLGVGTYRVVVRASSPALAGSAFATMVLQIVPEAVPTAPWTAYAARLPQQSANDDLKRGIASEALNKPLDAEGWYRQALDGNESDQGALIRLAALLGKQGDTKALAQLSGRQQLQQATDPPTVVLIASALDKTGDPGKAIQLLDSQLKVQPGAPELYRTLAEAWEQSGDHRRAEENRAKAKEVAH